MSRNTFHDGRWPLLHASEYQRFKSAIIRLCQMIVAKEDLPDGVCEAIQDSGQAHGCSSDLQVCQRAGSMHPAVLVRFLRHSTAERLAVRAPRHVWECLFAPRKSKRSWLRAICSDIKWLSRCGNTFSSVDCSPPAVFLHMARASPRETIAAVKRPNKVMNLACVSFETGICGVNMNCFNTYYWRKGSLGSKTFA